MSPAALLRRLVLSLLLATSCFGQSGPEDLEKWRDWVLDGHDEVDCPWQMSQSASRVCTWPGTLELALASGGLAFSFEVQVMGKRATVSLPGGIDRWPSHVAVNGKDASIVDINGVPSAILERGRHLIKGIFHWENRPGSLAVPADIALVTLSEAGKIIPVNRENGQVLFSRRQGVSKTRQKNAVNIEVYRRLSDGIPITLTTQVTLSVSGEPREMTIGQLAWDGTQVTGIQSPLPARIEPNGNLKIQLVPGSHQVVVQSRFIGPAPSVTTKPQTEHWPQIEYLSFAADTSLRQVKLSGAPSIDTSQIPIPQGWRDLPTYRLDSGAVLEISTEFRGDDSPAANQLSVQRQLWLDFNGAGLTGLETVQGKMFSDWRLNASPDTKIGRANVANNPVMVTELDGIEGVEIRSPQIELSAVTRVANPEEFSAVGWRSKADAFSARLHTPPGWRVLHASGVDRVLGTWVSKWDLWGIFLLLIVVAATRKIMGMRIAILAALTMIIGFHESGLPIAYFPALLLLIPLLPVLSGRIKRVAAVISVALCVVMTLLLIQYAVSAFRLALHPSLERATLGRYDANSYTLPVGSTIDDTEAVALQELDLRNAAEGMVLKSASAPSRDMPSLTAPKPLAKPDAYSLGENDRVQTGPGAPLWLWQSIDLQSTGPLLPAQQISIHYSPPWLTRIWRILSVLLAAAYGGLLVVALVRNIGGDRKQEQAVAPAAATAATILLGMILIGSPQGVDAADYPPQHLLDELERRALQPPECMPHCISISRGALRSTADSLEIVLTVYADAPVLLALPTPTEGWQVAAIRVDGASGSPTLRQNGLLAVQVEQGHHQVSVSGPLVGESASITLPLPIHNIVVSGDHWLVSGLVDGRAPSGTIALRAINRIRQEQEQKLVADPVVPFVLVNRRLILGTHWRLETTVQRLAPADGPVSVQIPLLGFEKPLSDAVHFTNGNAHVQLGAGEQQVSWESVVDPVEQMDLTAGVGANYVESWRLIPSALWRIAFKGIPPVKEAGGAGTLQPLWRPWPGEHLTLEFQRAMGVEGATYTVEEATLDYEAGRNVQKSKLSLQLLASIGQEYTIDLPEDATVLSVVRDGSNLNIPDSNSVTVALQPGRQSVEIGFQQEGEISWRGRTPVVHLPSGASNISITYRLPQDRWPLYLSGPAIGPAMLYWGVFWVIVLAAFLLSTLSRRLGLDLPVTLLGWLLLGIGLSTVNSYGVLVVAIFFFAHAFRQHLKAEDCTKKSFNLIQIFLGIWTVVTITCVVGAIPMGLLSSPNMIVAGNNSWSHVYNYFQDRSAPDSFPQVMVISLSLAAYRVVMLAWSLWLANRIISWAKWWWRSFSSNVVWNQRGKTPQSGTDKA
ncbi:MAG: hypothetical protein KDI10_09135 [Halioglobus sp.]|nr:hypothetical protein [Halioglobus sp.]